MLYLGLPRVHLSIVVEKYEIPRSLLFVKFCMAQIQPSSTGTRVAINTPPQTVGTVISLSFVRSVFYHINFFLQRCVLAQLQVQVQSATPWRSAQVCVDTKILLAC